MATNVCECPICQMAFQVNPEMAGAVVQCPACARAIQLPNELVGGAGKVCQAIRVDICTCPDCQQGFGYTTQMLGTTVACPHCNTSYRLKVDGTLGKEKVPISPAASGVNQTSGSSTERTTKPPRLAAESIPKPPPAAGFRPAEFDLKGSDSAFRANAEIPVIHSTPEIDLAGGDKLKRPLETILPEIRVGEPGDSERSAAPVPNIRSKSVAPGPLAPAAKLSPAPAAPESSRQPPTFQVTPKPQELPGAELLPPKFYSSDPTIIRRRKGARGGEQPFVLLPDAAGGFQRVNNTVIRIQHEGETIVLAAPDPKQVKQRRMIINLLTLVICLAILYFAFRMLLN